MRSESLIDFICETCKGYNYLNVCLVNLNHVQGFDSHLAIPQSGESVTKKTLTAAPMRKRIGQQARKDEIVVREEFYLVIMYLFVCLLMYIFFWYYFGVGNGYSVNFFWAEVEEVMVVVESVVEHRIILHLALYSLLPPSITLVFLSLSSSSPPPSLHHLLPLLSSPASPLLTQPLLSFIPLL